MAIELKALEHFMAMQNFLHNLQNFSYDNERSIDDFTEDGEQRIQLGELNLMLVARPNRLRGIMHADTGDYGFYYDGRTIVLFRSAQNVYLSIPFTGALEELMNLLGERFHVNPPLFDLLSAKPQILVLDKVEKGRYLGLHIADQVKCHHLVFSQPEHDWQVWIDPGPKPWPRKLVVHYKKEPGAPFLTTVIRNWNDAPDIGEKLFEFVPPPNAQKMEVALLGR